MNHRLFTYLLFTLYFFGCTVGKGNIVHNQQDFEQSVSQAKPGDEVKSSKTGQNIYRSKTFFECEGTLTMRHGNETVIEDNYFFGNGNPRTSEIRVINEKQTVRNNYCYGLTGFRFRGSLVVLNGVSKSLLNRDYGIIGNVAL